VKRHISLSLKRTTNRNQQLGGLKLLQPLKFREDTPAEPEKTSRGSTWLKMSYIKEKAMGKNMEKKK
jgi:hypothetical protein